MLLLNLRKNQANLLLSVAVFLKPRFLFTTGQAYFTKDMHTDIIFIDRDIQFFAPQKSQRINVLSNFDFVKHSFDITCYSILTFSEFQENNYKDCSINLSL